MLRQLGDEALEGTPGEADASPDPDGDELIAPHELVEGRATEPQQIRRLLHSVEDRLLGPTANRFRMRLVLCRSGHALQLDALEPSR